MKKVSLHKGWFILAITVLNIFACLGLGRFSLGAILPFMREGLVLTYTEAGIIASAVFLGYLLSVISVGYFVQRFSTKNVILAALLVLSLGMTLSVVAFNFWMAYVSLFIIGLGSGGVNVPSLSLIRRWFSQKYRGMALGITNSGSGLGMFASGFLVPMLMLISNEGWRISWGALAGAVIVIFLLNLFFLIEDPRMLNVLPVGQKELSEKEETVQIGHGNLKAESHLIEHVYRSKWIFSIGLIYFTWGFSYLIYSTFFIDYLINDAAIESTTAGQFFAIAGVVSIVSGFIWGSLSDRIGRMLTLFIVYFCQATLLLAFVFTTHPSIIFIETLLYALTLWAVPTVIVAAVSDMTKVEKTSASIGFITLMFGIGQWISPVISGALIDFYSSYTIAFYLSAGICYAGSIGCIVVHLKLLKSPFSQSVEV
ncbi:MFS transporter [Halalkalibacterium ligniniphilum]|uniref:MFS transporter n=1 Tax=Halalkalibacterium ligniniphilum TaxID=1134413 RepID=UPI0003455C4D|nr:MFS transporter [Halalkalibacterium ligniniphilum]